MPHALIISPQPWVGFQVSKHHYAQALAAAGWDVVFADPPDMALPRGDIQLEATDIPGIRNLRYRPGFPYGLKFKARWLFDWMMAGQARRIIRTLPPLDLVWDFDNAYQFRDLRNFGASQIIFHLVDPPSLPALGNKQADVFLYLHHSYIQSAASVLNPEHCIGHGLGRFHAEAARAAQHSSPALPSPELPGPDRATQIGYVGNLGSPWLDWDMLAGMVAAHTGASFTFWGPLPQDPQPTLASLRDHPRVRFPGLTQPQDIVAAASGVDVWLVPFGPGGTINSHKVLEYLSTGKVVVMDWLEAYDGNPLVAMAAAPGDGSLPQVLAGVLADLDRWNAPDAMAARRAHALARTYDHRIARVFDILGDRVPPLQPTPAAPQTGAQTGLQAGPKAGPQTSPQTGGPT